MSKTAATTPIDVAAKLQELARTAPGPAPVISVYLDTRWSDEHQRERVRVFLKNEIHRAAAMAAGRLDADAKADRPQPVDHDPAALGEGRAEAPHLSQLAERYQKDGLVVLAVNAWDEEKDVIGKFVSDNRLQQRVLLNGREVFKGAYVQKSIPVVLWLDRGGRILYTHLDYDAAHAKVLDEYTARLVASG